MALKQYVGPSLGDFGTSGNWSPSGVPGDFDDAEININNGALFVVVSEIASQVVNSITTGPNDELEVINHTNLSLVHGTGSGSNQGILEFFQGSLMLGGTFDNRGSIHLDGGTTSLETGNAEIDVDAANTVLDGGGNVQMRIGGGPSSNLITGGADVTLTNVDNIISGDGTIGGPSSFINESHGTIETNNATSTHGGTLAIFEKPIPGFAPAVFTNEGLIIANSGGTLHISVSGAPGFASGIFTNEGTIAVDSGGTLIFGLDGETQTFVNDGSIELSAIPGNAIVQIAGNTTIGTTGTTISLIDLLAPSDQIVSDGNVATLTLAGLTQLEGTGTVGDASKLVLINNATILANTSGQPLTLEALNATNNGVLEARGGGHLLINDPFDNSGLILVADTGSLIAVVQPLTGSGPVDIADNGALSVFGNGSIAGDVLFNGANATLSEVPGAIAGTVNGAAFTDAIIFIGVNSTGDNVVWHQTSLTGGTLSLFHGGTQLATLNMGGQFNSSDFAVSAVTSAGSLSTEVTVQFPVSPLLDTTGAAVAVEGSMYPAVGSANEVTLLTTQFLPAQIANAITYGFDPLVYATEALGLAFAFGNENQSTAFENNFGPSHAATPNTTAGDAAFAAAASAAIFGSASTPNIINVIDGFVTNWKAFYTSNGIPGIPGATADQIDLAARGASWGDAVGVALANNLGPLLGQTINFLKDADQGTAVYSAPLSSQPVFHAMGTSIASTLLMGVAEHSDASFI